MTFGFYYVVIMLYMKHIILLIFYLNYKIASGKLYHLFNSLNFLQFINPTQLLVKNNSLVL